ncbi:MAG: hypothetical protein NUV46_03905 [Nanoarchaeota archaeon]|nr:hypothetical protein [Nanoarchaeota archaeon]
MKINEDYARKTIEEVAPLVEEFSGLETDLDFPDVTVHKKFAEDFKDAEAYYVPNLDIFHFLEKYKLKTKNIFKSLAGHETMHHAQYNSFKNLIKREIYFYNLHPIDNSKNFATESPLRRLIEGDATLIQRLIYKKLPKSKLEMLIPNLYDPCYFLWSNILKKKFNANRKDINELYTAPFEELDKIFGGSK